MITVLLKPTEEQRELLQAQYVKLEEALAPTRKLIHKWVQARSFPYDAPAKARAAAGKTGAHPEHVGHAAIRMVLQTLSWLAGSDLNPEDSWVPTLVSRSPAVTDQAVYIPDVGMVETEMPPPADCAAVEVRQLEDPTKFAATFWHDQQLQFRFTSFTTRIGLMQWPSLLTPMERAQIAVLQAEAGKFEPDDPRVKPIARRIDAILASAKHREPSIFLTGKEAK